MRLSVKVGTYSLTGTKNGTPFDDISMGTINCYSGPLLAEVGTYEVYVNVFDGCASTPWGPVTVVVDPVTYDLTMQVDPAIGGTTIPSVGGSPHNYPVGTVVTITATPASGYSFVNWTGDVANTGLASTTVTMDADKTVTANFAQITYDLTMQVDPAIGGTTIPSVGGSPHNYPVGTVVTITATPASGYSFVNWTGDVANTGLASTTVTMDADKTVTANFVRTIVIDASDLHANLASADVKPLWDLHVWSWIRNNSGQNFGGYIRIKSEQGTGGITKYYPSESGYTSITIVPGKSKYPTAVDSYWLMSEVATGQGKPSDVVVDIWIFDLNHIEMAHTSKNAN